MPLDVLPDISPIVGFADDITVFGLVFAGFAAELEDYKKWKQNNSLPDMISGREDQQKQERDK